MNIIKKIIPILITIIICAFASLYAFAFLILAFEASLLTETLISLMLAIIPIGIIIAMIFTLIERLKEIKEEDKNDISKY